MITLQNNHVPVRWIVRVGNRITGFLILFLYVLFAAFGGYSLWDSGQVYAEAQPEQYEQYKPVPPLDMESFEELRAVNPEVFGWLTVYGTNIDYPLVQAEDNEKYVSLNVKCQPSGGGAIFLASENQKNFLDFNNMIYGHYMEKDAMFGDIGRFDEKDYFEKHEYGSLIYEGKEHGIHFFAFLEISAYDSSIYRPPLEHAEDRQVFLENLYEKAWYSREIELDADSRLVLLSTCKLTETDGRQILVGKVTDEMYENPYEKKEAGKKKRYVDEQFPQSILKRMPEWGWFIIGMFVFLILVTAINRKLKEKK